VSDIIEKGRGAMWYFAWILGLGLACAFAILNAMWFEVMEGSDESHPG
jgi:cyd operon protein YbgT